MVTKMRHIQWWGGGTNVSVPETDKFIHDLQADLTFELYIGNLGKSQIRHHRLS